MDFITIDEAIRQVPGGVNSLETITWVAHCICISLAVMGGYTAALFFNDDDYISGKVAIIGSFIIGAAPHFATFFLFT